MRERAIKYSGWVKKRGGCPQRRREIHENSHRGLRKAPRTSTQTPHERMHPPPASNIRRPSRGNEKMPTRNLWIVNERIDLTNTTYGSSGHMSIYENAMCQSISLQSTPRHKQKFLIDRTMRRRVRSPRIFPIPCYLLARQPEFLLLYRCSSVQYTPISLLQAPTASVAGNEA